MPDSPRCAHCGMLHPLIEVCPYIAEQEVREEYISDGRRRRLAARVIRTRYFPGRAALIEAALASTEDGDADEAPEAAQP